VPSISRSTKPATKASALIVISGAMAASLALPASAAAPVARVRATAAVAHAAPVAGVAPSAAQAPLAPPPFGDIAFTGVVKPKPVVVQRKVVTVSRSHTRSAIPTPTPIPTPAADAAGILSVAASLAGIYYVYGGTTPAGFDCSGYTQYVFGKVGIKLPRTAEQQRQVTTPVTNPQQFLRGLIGHRMQREKQIVRLVGEGKSVISEIVASAYPGLDPRLIPAAGGSVWAHLMDLERRGLVISTGETWTIPQ